MLLTVILVSIAIVGFICAVMFENRTSKYLPGSIFTVGLKFFIVVILANVLKTFHLLAWISIDKGIEMAAGILGTIAATAPLGIFLSAHRWEIVLPFGSVVALADSIPRSHPKKIVMASIVAAISGVIIGFLIPDRLVFARQPSKIFLLVASVAEGALIGFVVGSIGRVPIKLPMPRGLVSFFTYVRAHRKASTSVSLCILVIVLYLLPRTSRVFLRLSGWREITIEYKDVAIPQNSPLTSFLFTMLNSWPLAGGDNVEWVSFKSAKKTLDFNLIGKHMATSDQEIELVVSRIDDLPLSDEFLNYRYFSKLDLRRELVYRDKTSSGTFTIDAAEFACTVYSTSNSNTKENGFAISSPLGMSVTVTRENRPTYVPGLKETRVTREWMSVRASDQVLGFSLRGANELMMLCRTARRSPEKGSGDVRISGKGLANPIVLGATSETSQSEGGTTVAPSGFVVEVRKPEGQVSIGILEGSANIALGSSDFQFITGNVSKITIRQPNGSMKLDTDDVRRLDIMDDVSIVGEKLKFARTEGEIIVEGQSRNIMLNGQSLAKPMLPPGITHLLGELLKFAK